MLEPEIGVTAGRVARGAPRPSTLQERVLRFVVEDRGHGVVEATAGSGKTTTLVQVAQVLPTTHAACFLAFNRATAAELRARLPPHVDATTVHALGRQVLKRAIPALSSAPLQTTKYRDLALTLLPSHWRRSSQPLEIAEYLSRVAGFTRLATASVPHAPEPAAVAARHGLESPVGPPETPALHALVPTLLEAGLAALRQGSLDYTDMLYAPLALALPPPRFDFVCVDEAQDLSPLTLGVVMRLVEAGARALFVGDPQQAIYAFAGADSRSMQRVASATSATVLPLSVSFRCPSRHVALARRFSPTMQPAPRAQAGHVRLIRLSELPGFAAQGDLIMSRVNAPLTGLQLRLAEAGKASLVLGEDLAKPTLALAWHLFGDAVPRDAERLASDHARNETARLEHELLTSPALAEALRVSGERHAALIILLRRLAPRGRLRYADLERTAEHLLGGAPLPAELRDAAKQPFAELEAAGAHRPVILSTIHKAKGREARRVLLLFPEELAPLPGPRPQPAQRSVVATPDRTPPTTLEAGSATEQDAEANVLFVALTRAREELVLVERTAGALAARLQRAELLGERGADEPEQALSTRWNQVLTLANVMASRQRGGRRARKPLFPSFATRRSGTS